MLVRELTAERVKRHFAELCRGPVERFELDNLEALNFVLHGALDGGALASLRFDRQGKTYGYALLRMQIDVPDELEVEDLIVGAKGRPSAPEAPDS